MADFFKLGVYYNNLVDPEVQSLNGCYGSYIFGCYTTDGQYPTADNVILDVCTDVWKPWWDLFGTSEDLKSNDSYIGFGRQTSTQKAENVNVARSYRYNWVGSGRAVGLSTDLNGSKCYIVGVKTEVSTTYYWYAVYTNGVIDILEITKSSFGGDEEITPVGPGPTPGGDKVGFPTLPSLDIFKTGLCYAYSFGANDKTSINALSSYLWSNDFITKISKVIDNAMDAIITMNIVPHSVSEGSSEQVVIGNVAIPDCSGNVVNSQFFEVNMGSITIPSRASEYLEYEPYTSVQLYLPYIGSVNLPTSEVIGKTIYIKYYCDILTASCNAMIMIGDSVVYSFTGACGFSTPITGANYPHYMSGLITAINGTGQMAMSGLKQGLGSIAKGVLEQNVTEYQRCGNSNFISGYLGVQKAYAIVTRNTVNPDYPKKTVNTYIASGDSFNPNTGKLILVVSRATSLT